MENVDEAPEGFPIKGNEDSMKFHEPDGQWFGQTVAEVWFDSARVRRGRRLHPRRRVS